jgi:hypothetical protein
MKLEDCVSPEALLACVQDSGIQATVAFLVGGLVAVCLALYRLYRWWTAEPSEAPSSGKGGNAYVEGDGEAYGGRGGSGGGKFGPGGAGGDATVIGGKGKAVGGEGGGAGT